MEHTHGPAGCPLPLLHRAKISPDEIWPITGSAQWYFQFYSVLSHFKGAGMTSSVDFVTHERIVSLRKEHCLTLSTPTSSHFLCLNSCLCIWPPCRVFVCLLFPLPGVIFFCFISWLHALHPQISLAQMLTRDFLFITTLLWETPHPSYPDLLFSVTVLITCHVHHLFIVFLPS